MFAVWEPILPTDYSSPGTAILARLSDRRVTQYWDKGHLFAEKLGHTVESDPGQPQPKCCTRQGIQWDEVAVYPPDVVTTADSPTRRTSTSCCRAQAMAERLLKSSASAQASRAPRIVATALCHQVEAGLLICGGSPAAPAPWVFSR